MGSAGYEMCEVFFVLESTRFSECDSGFILLAKPRSSGSVTVGSNVTHSLVESQVSHFIRLSVYPSVYSPTCRPFGEDKS